MVKKTPNYIGGSNSKLQTKGINSTPSIHHMFATTSTVEAFIMHI